jgi:Lipopolysaccharide-assembly
MSMTVARRPLFAALALLATCGCESAGHFSVLGYTTRPNYDECIHSVYVPIFENNTLRRGLEFDLTRAVVREIEQKTPYKVISDRSRADTELSGTILVVSKNLLNRNQLNEIREAEMVVTVALVWKDLRTGEVLSKPRKTPDVYPTPGIPALDIPDVGAGPTAGAPPPPPPVLPVKPDATLVLDTGIGTYIPELGQSTTTAYQQAINRLAVQIVSQMEKPW